MAKKKEEGGEIHMPPLTEEIAYMVDTLLDAGISTAAGMGSVPLTWADLAAWQQGTGIALAPWEARLIRRMSSEYLAESHRAEKPDCPPPWRIELAPEQRTQVAARVKNVLRD